LAIHVADCERPVGRGDRPADPTNAAVETVNYARHDCDVTAQVGFDPAFLRSYDEYYRLRSYGRRCGKLIKDRRLLWVIVGVAGADGNSLLAAERSIPTVVASGGESVISNDEHFLCNSP
jgi:hypothetical protein